MDELSFSKLCTEMAGSVSERDTSNFHTFYISEPVLSYFYLKNQVKAESVHLLLPDSLLRRYLHFYYSVCVFSTSWFLAPLIAAKAKK